MWAERLPSGKWRGIWRDENQTRRSKGGFTREAQALRYAGEQESKASRGEVTVSGRGLTWAEWRPTWTALRAVEASTEKRDRSALDRHIEPYWGGWRLGRIRRDDVQIWVNSMVKSDDLAPASVRRYYYVFAASMKAAMLSHHVVANPCNEITLPTVVDSEDQSISWEEFRQIAVFLEEPFYTAALILVGAGPRAGEMSGLHQHRINLDVPSIKIAESWSSAEGRIKPYPKGREPRDVPIPGFLAQHLRDVIKPSDRKTCGFPHRRGSACGSPLLLTWQGKPLTADGLRYRWYAAVRMAGVDPLRPHGLRHTYATWLRRDGIPLEVVKEMLGHKELTTTMRYARFGNSQHAAVIAALDARSEAGLL